jgi:preprotein translocase YajC subunit
MTAFSPLLIQLLGSTSKTTTKSSNPTILIVLVVVAVAGYFLFLKPQQRKAAAARANQGSGYEVGDEVQTIGGMVGTILEIHGDRYTLLTGSMGSDGNLEGAQPTRLVFVRQAIARKVQPVVNVEPDPDIDGDDDDHGHESVEIEDHDGEAEEA